MIDRLLVPLKEKKNMKDKMKMKNKCEIVISTLYSHGKEIRKRIELENKKKIANKMRGYEVIEKSSILRERGDKIWKKGKKRRKNNSEKV